MRPRGVLQVIDTLDPGGAESVAVTLANQFAFRGYKSLVCVTRRLGTFETQLGPSVQVTTLRRARRWDIGGLIRFRRLLRETRPDIVHAHGVSSALFCAVAVPPYSTIKLIFHDHNPTLRMRSRFWESLVIRPRVAHWIAVSREISDFATQRVGMPDSKVSVVPNPVKLRGTHKQCDRVGRGHGHGVCIANYRPSKDHPNLLRAVHLARNEGFDGVVTCAGGNDVSEYYLMLERMRANLDIERRIQLLPCQVDVSWLLDTATFGVLSSVAEGLPIALLEYMATGLPVITTNVGDCGTTVSAASCGWVVPKADSQQFAQALLALFDAAPDELRRIGHHGRMYVEQHHSPVISADHIEQIYERVLTH